MGLVAAIRREYIYVSSILRTLWLLRLVKPQSTRTIADIVAAQARKTPDAPAIIHSDGAWSYAVLDARANAYAHWAMRQGVRHGDAVALLMENRPDFIAAWLGMFKAGASVALINTNLTGQSTPLSVTRCARFLKVRCRIWNLCHACGCKVRPNRSRAISTARWRRCPAAIRGRSYAVA